MEVNRFRAKASGLRSEDPRAENPRKKIKRDEKQK